ncbi:hypothetical protein BASA83_010487 [Batrachochytrium salamandrivorans]|nr:hypothetical protein BASA62_005480 [Batrachochytrium salamandrivorans]KAH9249916.1 hypothetical protein BASA81_012293 [Batrachochytrium salamandrivorans]KAH9266503.1 hypothetical protein BASA83_010487 [Batrachochytrium salamandrivorans]
MLALWSTQKTSMLSLARYAVRPSGSSVARIRAISTRYYSDNAAADSPSKQAAAGLPNGQKESANAEPPTSADAHLKVLAEKDAEIAQLQDVYRRALADAENVRQRTRKEIEEKQSFAIQKFAKELLNTADILSMALDAVPAAERSAASGNSALQNLYTGVSMTRAELLKTLKQFGVEPYDPAGKKFDHNLHQALFQAPVPGKEPGSIFQVTKIGYMLHDRVLRPAQVGVVQSE